jgi:hypothetical protein
MIFVQDTPLPLSAQFNIEIEPIVCCDFGVDGHIRFIPDCDHDPYLEI